jgi:hypothetical protein
VLPETTFIGHVKFYLVVFSVNAKNYSNQANSNWEVANEKYHYTLQFATIISTRGVLHLVLIRCVEVPRPHTYIRGCCRSHKSYLLLQISWTTWPKCLKILRVSHLKHYSLKYVKDINLWLSASLSNVKHLLQFSKKDTVSVRISESSVIIKTCLVLKAKWNIQLHFSQ